MAIFKRKKGGTRVGNAVRSAFGGTVLGKKVNAAKNVLGIQNNNQNSGSQRMEFPVSYAGQRQIEKTVYGAPLPNKSVAPFGDPLFRGPNQTLVPFGDPSYSGPNQTLLPQASAGKTAQSTPRAQRGSTLLPSSSNVSSNSQSGLPVSPQARSQGSSQASSPVAQSSFRSAVATPSAVSGPNAVGQGSLAVPVGGSMIGSTDFNYNRTPQQIAEEEARNNLANFNRQEGAQDVNQNRIFRDTMRQFQGEIDATNSVYAEQLRQAGIMGQSRLGSTRAENFNSGAVDSSFGNAAQERVASDNASVESGIMAQKLMAIAQIEGQARQLGNQFFQDRRSAKEAGLTNYLESIRGAGVAKEAISEDIAMSIFNSGVTDDEIEPAKLTRIAKDAGITVQQIKNSFRVIKQQAEATAMEEQRAIAKDEREMAKLETDSRTTLSKDQVLVDSEGNLIATGQLSEREGGKDQAIEQLARQNTLKQAESGLNALTQISKNSSINLGGFARKQSSRIQGTPAFDLKKAITTLQAILSFSALQEMRNASKTGGALGQVSERELDLLGSTVSNLDIGLSPEILIANLQTIEQTFNNLQAGATIDLQGNFSASSSPSDADFDF